MALPDIHVWLGRFDSSDRFNEYLEEHSYEDDRGDRPLSQFAAGQGETWYDHDGIESNFSDDPRRDSVSSRGVGFYSTFSYTRSYLDAVIVDAARTPLPDANAVIGIDASEVASPRSVTDDGVELVFLGTYHRLPPAPTFDRASTKLSLTDQQLTEVPPEVFELVDLVELSLADNSLISIPDEIEGLGDLEEIYLYKNQLTDLPDALFRLPRLRKIMAQENALRSLPEAISDATNLTSLTVSRNRITRLPEEIGELSQLELLDVAGNELTELPSTIGRLGNLTTLRLNGNPMVRLPDEITALSISGQLSLPRGLDREAQSPTVREWLVERGR